MLKIAWRPHVGGRKKWKLDSSRQYADNVIRSAVQSNRLAENVAVAAKAVMPERITDYDDRLACHLCVVR